MRTLITNATLVTARGCDVVVLDDHQVLLEDGVIRVAAPAAQTDFERLDEVIDARDYIVIPGLINTHHHLYQSLTRGLASVQNESLFGWLTTLYGKWRCLDYESIKVAASVSIAERLLSGCTTTTDHLYLFPNDASLDDEIRAAHELGIRFHPCRGSMSLGQSQGGLPPDRVVQSESAILADCQRVIEEHHDPDPYSMCRIVLAPCSPFSVTADLMKESLALARQHSLHLHTHVAETLDEESFCLGKFGCRPVEYMEKLGWVGPDVSYAHAIHLNEEEIQLLAETGTGVAHCPSSNMRLGSGIAPISEMLDAGVKVGIAVDGSASNDSSHLLAEARMAMLLQRVQKGAGALSAQEALEMATLGGASILGRDDIGSLEVGQAADFIAISLNRLEYAGALHDPLAALVFCTPVNVALSVINGRIVVDGGRLVGLDLEEIVARHNRISRQMVERATT